MELLIKIKNNKITIALLLLTTLFISCSDYLDVNTDKDSPTVAPLSLLLTNTQVGVGSVTDFNNFSGNILAVYTHQMTTREEYDQYGTKVGSIPVNNDWDTIYLTLTDIQTLIDQATASGDLVYVGIAQMQKAYLMALAVDLWGDVPYTEATNLTAGIVSPKFDAQKAIYADVFKLIATAKANIATNAGTQKPAANDLFYKGDTAKWIKFANTFKLKLYNQVRLTNDFDTAGFKALVAENNFFTSAADDFQFNHTASVAPEERNNLYLDSYNSTQFGAYQSPWFYEILKGVNPNIHANNPDPRMKYFFFNQLKAGVLPPDTGNATTGNPNADYWDKSTGFFSIRFGTVGPNQGQSAENSYTYPGIFQTGGRYDDGKGGIMDGNTGTGIAPFRMLTYDEFLYIQAELIHVGQLTTAGTASAKLNQAMKASFAKVDQVVSLNKSSQIIPVLAGSTTVTAFITNVLAEFNAAAPAKKLEIIMTQKWVGTCGDPMDQYTDYRRTGFPILANPLGASPEYQLNNGDAWPLIDSQTIQNNTYQVSLFWPQNELNSNLNAPAQKDATTYKIFWDL
ncbi:SusD/RagB family nutrient-binding outer membrane lipoprotein [Flavobacterium sp. ALD4]|uniref:SusD/RagB family nutrient-binding outer membrane lipoprotein n=1 Tax=Flavobacterium sp. ALD4 TaxID=2058314 RepID=UPI000C32DD69|nr:SusD/RagB family nutrient-binding outer membrane lipoprotein [Flavobacterium sp. ALD4]PKH67593.1 SusD/RagB family nutrient-binding outer membrane lipoprotein [Flavobacterium sp. ALD4]